MISRGSRFAATALAVLMTTSIPAQVALTLSDDEFANELTRAYVAYLGVADANA